MYYLELPKIQMLKDEQAMLVIRLQKLTESVSDFQRRKDEENRRDSISYAQRRAIHDKAFDEWLKAFNAQQAKRDQ